jgi:uncharacterized membrane protein YphA (DoxX/SURF4 family)
MLFGVLLRFGALCIMIVMLGAIFTYTSATASASPMEDTNSL